VKTKVTVFHRDFHHTIRGSLKLFATRFIMFSKVDEFWKSLTNYYV